MSSEIPIKKILVPLDGSDFSFRAAEYAVKLAKLTGAEILCLHVVVTLPYIEYGKAGLAIHHYLESVRKEADAWYERVRRMGNVKVSGETILDVASNVESIVSFASERKIDLIVIGTKGRTGLKRILMGSVAGGVVTLAECPVLVVR